MKQVFTVLLAMLVLVPSIPANAVVGKFAKPQDGARVNYVDTGKVDGIPIVLIHAFPLNQAMWESQVDFLKKSYRVITFDIRGLGKSKNNTPYTMEFVVDDLITLLDQLKVDKAVLGGLSMGGFVALRAVERNPERFMGLILANTKSEPDSDSSKLGRYRAIKSVQDQGLSAFAEGFIKSSLAPSVLTSKPEIFKRTKKIANANNPEGVCSALLALTSRTDTTSSLSKIQIPTLIMQGEFDSVIPAASVQMLHEKIKGSELFVVPNAGHLSNLENEKAFNERIGDFVGRLKK